MLSEEEAYKEEFVTFTVSLIYEATEELSAMTDGVSTYITAADPQTINNMNTAIMIWRLKYLIPKKYTK